MDEPREMTSIEKLGTKSDMQNEYSPRILLQESIGILLLVSVTTWLVYPFGEYAILDDWAYAKSLEHLHYDGEERILDWNPMSLLGLLYWTIPFTKTFGFSFTVTKISVIVLFAIECLVVLWLLRLCKVPRNLSYAGLLTLMFQPLHFVHCFMFMTDVPSVTWKLIALACYGNGLKKDDQTILWFTMGSLAAGFAFLIRQNGVLVPIAFAVYVILFQRQLIRPAYLATAFAPFGSIVVGFQYWYRHDHGPTLAFERSVIQLKDYLGDPPWAQLPAIGFSIAMYLGFFVIPIACLVSIRKFQLVSGKSRWIFLGGAWLLLDLGVYLTFAEGRIFPYIWNVVTPFGFFEPTQYLIGGQLQVVWGKPTAWVISILSLLALLVLLNRLLSMSMNATRRSTPRDLSKSVMLLLLLFLGAELGYSFCTAPMLFDRHLLPLAPVGIVLLCAASREEKRLCWPAYAVCLAPLAFYSIAATHDLHNISRLAFYAGNDLNDKGVSPKLINAGYAFDCWYTYEEMQHQVRTTPSALWWQHPFWVRIPNPGDRNRWDELRGIVKWRQHHWWIGPSDKPILYRYLITNSLPLHDGKRDYRFGVVRQYDFQRWWPWGMDSIYVLEDSSRAQVLGFSSRSSADD